MSHTVAPAVHVVAAGDPPPRIEARHILGIASTGHGASLSFAGRDGQIRGSVLDRWARTKHTSLFARAEADDIRQGTDATNAGIRRILTHAYGRFPEFLVWEDVFAEWVTWLLADCGVSRQHIDLIVTSDSYFAVCRERLGSDLRRWFPAVRAVVLLEHHEIHKRQAFWQSGFDEAAVLTLDTCGEVLERLARRQLCGTISRMSTDGHCRSLTEMLFPESSVGLLYAEANHHLGFRQGQEGKTMGLAPYGGPALFDQIRSRLRMRDDGSFGFVSRLEFGEWLRVYVPPREPRSDAEITPRHMDVAFAVQELTNAVVTNAFEATLRLTGLDRLAYAGGVALNSVANGIAIARTGPRQTYIAPNASDTGQALGAALAGAYECAGWPHRGFELSDYLGPRYDGGEIERAVALFDGPVVEPDDVEAAGARCIANGHIVARFEGGAEFGPRALGHRSIICDPRRPDMKDYLNFRVKHREAFRPFAPSVLAEHATEWFDLDDRSPYMLRVVAVRDAVRSRVPAITHVDGTARVQTVTEAENGRYWRLIRLFHTLTGVPLVLNTSFNVQGEPIVERPADAVRCFMSTEIDVLLLGTMVLSKRSLDTYLTRSRPETETVSAADENGRRRGPVRA